MDAVAPDPLLGQGRKAPLRQHGGHMAIMMGEPRLGFADASGHLTAKGPLQPREIPWPQGQLRADPWGRGPAPAQIGVIPQAGGASGRRPVRLCLFHGQNVFFIHTLGRRKLYPMYSYLKLR